MSSWIEKLFVFGLLCSMVVFWFAIAPASITSRPAEATMVATQPMPKALPEVQETRKPEEDPRKKAREAYANRMARIESLKQRRRDTPPEARERMAIGLEDRPQQRGGDRRSLSRFEDIPDLPVNY